MRFTVLTLFPEIFQGFLAASLLGRARAKGEESGVAVALLNIRDYAENRHHRVDDASYGGGPGMVLQAPVLDRALAAAREIPATSRRVVLLTPQGERFRQETAVRLAACDHVILVAGRYEGVDERWVTARVEEEISLGDFVLNGGEVAAMAIIECVARLAPGVVGKPESLAADSFAAGLLDHPHYTRPRVWEGREVPAVLSSGHHGEVVAWRRRQALLRTLLRRPDLLEGAPLTPAERRLLSALATQLEEME